MRKPGPSGTGDSTGELPAQAYSQEEEGGRVSSNLKALLWRVLAIAKHRHIFDSDYGIERGQLKCRCGEGMEIQLAKGL
jgi:hypothetical protein